MSGNKRSKRLIAAVLCMAMTGSVLAYLPNEVSAQISTEVVNGSFEVGYAGMDVYGWHLTAMTDKLAEGIQTDTNATIQSLEAYTLKTEESENTDRSKVAALTKCGKGTVAMTSQAFAITGGERYTVSYDAVLKGWTPTAPGVQVAVKEMTADGTLVKWTIPTTDSTDAGDMTTSNAVVNYPTTEWTTIHRTFDASENTTQAELYIWVGADDDMTGTILFDKVGVSTSEIETETTSENPISSMMEGGDANSDSESNIDICDVIHMKKYLADEDVTVSDSADMNKNELVNEDDLTLLRWKLLGVTTTAEADKVGIRTDLSTALSEEANDLINSVYALPAVSRLEGFNGNSIETATLEFAKLNAQIKAKVSNRKTLSVLENVYDENYKMLYDMTDISGFSKHQEFDYSEVTLKSGTDETYGNVLVAHSDYTDQYGVHVTVTYNPTALDVTGYDKVCFYVYNGAGSDRSFYFDNMSTVHTTLAQGKWTKVEIPATDFVNGSYFGIQSVQWWGACDIKFSAIWAEKDNAVADAQAVIEMIDALPTVAQLTGYHEDEIREARAAYDALSDFAKQLVNNYENLTALEDEYQTNYKMLYDMSDISGFSKHQEFDYSEITFKSGTDETYGNVLVAHSDYTDQYGVHVTVTYNPTAFDLTGYDKVCFYVYNGAGSDRDFYFNNMSTVHATLPKGTWTKVEIPATDFANGSYFGIQSVQWWGACDIKFSAIWAETASKSAQNVINMIAALPSASELEGYQGAELEAARAAYNVLSDDAKSKVTNYEKLTSLESVYATNYKMLYSMSDISPFAIHDDYPGYQYFTLTSGTDETYGKLLNATYVNESTGDYHIVIKYAKPADLATQLSGYEKVCFYVYNGRSDNRGLMANFGGGLKTEYKTLNKEAWTKIEVPVADFINGSYFGIYSVGWKTGTQEFKFSPIWAESSSQLAQSVIDMIDALPCASELEGYHGAKIEAAEAAYAALSDSAKEKVSNYSTLTALESAYQTKYKMLYDMSNISGFTKITSWGGFNYFNLSKDTDDEYGKLLNATFTTSTAVDGQHILINYPSTSSATLSGYDYVCFYVYNDSPRNISLLGNFGGSLKTEYKTLVAGEWTKVQVPASDFASGSYFGILDPGYVIGTQQFKFSPIWAEKSQ